METVNWDERLIERTIAPTARTTTWFRLWIAFLLTGIGWGFYAWFFQVRDGLVVTGMRDRISWGLYISVFVFFAGISMAGTLISAILRVSNAGWRTPITRIAESITVIALICAAGFVVMDMGRPERLANVIVHGRWQSPILWDVLSVTTYLIASAVYLYVPMVPDLALFRDRIGDRAGKVRGWIYRTLAINWRDTEQQHAALAKAITVLMVMIIPVAVSVHTVVSWIFAMTLRVGWNTTIFGFFFVAGAIFSGVATLIIVLAVLRKVYKLDEYISRKHFVNLGYLMAALSVVMMYSNVTEKLTSGYKFEEGELFAFRQLFLDDFAGMFWFYMVAGLVMPALIVLYRRTRTIAGLVVAAILVDIGMFVERYFIVVTGLRVPLLDYEPSNYFPTWVEWSIVGAGLAGFMLLITLFAKIFPLMAVWEMEEHHMEEVAIEHAHEDLRREAAAEGKE